MGFFSRGSKVKKLVEKREYDELVERHLAGEVVVPEIISLLEDKAKNVREDAAFALGSIGGKDPQAVSGAIPRLTSLLEDEVESVRGSAAQALGMIEVVEALEKLRGLLSDSGKVCVYGKWITVGEVAQEAIERIEKR